MTLNILYEDQELIAVEKDAGVFIHPMKEDPSSKENNLLFQVRDYLQQFVYAINRLDRPVSGIVLFSKQQELVARVQEQWHSPKTKKFYTALCMGEILEAGQFDSPLGKMDSNGKEKVYQEALTHYFPQIYFKNEHVTLLKVQIFTGRYHQIRRHFRKAVKPLIGDRKHGKGPINNHFESVYGLKQIFLHCHRLELEHPVTKELLEINCKLPAALDYVLLKMKEA